MALEFNLRLSISDRDFNEKLDQAAAERAKLHAQQLAQAAEEHRRVLRSAELEVERIRLEEEHARIQREEAQKREVERLKQEKAREEAEAHRRALEAKQREEEVIRRSAEHQKKIQEAEARLRAQKEQDAAAERQKKEKEEADRKAAESAAAVDKARAQQAAQQPASQAAPAITATPVAPSTATPSASSQTSDVEQIHAKYLALHARMKKFRVEFQNEHKQKTSPLKGPVGDARREIRVRLGQITVERKDSVAAIKRLRENCFDIALNTRGPMIDIRPYIVSHAIPPLANEAEAAYPAFLLYIWICFEKSLLKQFEKEAANEDGRTIQEIGLIAASLLSDSKYMWKNTIPLSDIVVAKLNRICPPLFGIRGTMRTREGQARLGWMPIDKNAPTPESYSQRLRGMGAGYAAMSLRISKGKAPAVPASEYWRAIVSICNTPSDELWPGHFALLMGLVRDYYKKFLDFYGVHARAVLRRAVIDLPARAPAHAKDAAGTVAVLAEGWKRQKISLE
jgi:nucleoporin GLE1